MNRKTLLWCAAFLVLSLPHDLCAQEKKSEAVKSQAIVRIDLDPPRPAPHFFHGHTIALLDLYGTAGRENSSPFKLLANTLRPDGLLTSRRVGPFHIKLGYIRMPRSFAQEFSPEKHSAFPAGMAKRGGLGLQIRW